MKPGRETLATARHDSRCMPAVLLPTAHKESSSQRCGITALTESFGVQFESGKKKGFNCVRIEMEYRSYKEYKESV